MKKLIDIASNCSVLFFPAIIVGIWACSHSNNVPARAKTEAELKASSRELMAQVRTRLIESSTKRCREGDIESCEYLWNRMEEKEHKVIERKYKHIACDAGDKNACRWIRGDQIASEWTGE